MSTPTRIESLAATRTEIGAGPPAALTAATLLTLLQPGAEPRPPMLVNREDETLEVLPVEQRIRPSAVALLQGVTIRPGWYLMQGDAYVLESLNNSILDARLDLTGAELPLEALLAPHRYAATAPPRPLAKPAAPYAWVSTFWWRNFGHWHIETLSALALLEMAGLPHTPLFPPLAPWQRASLAHAGYPPSRYVELPDQSPVTVEALLFPSPAWLFQGQTLDLFGIAPQLAPWLRRIGTSILATPATTPLPKRFFISRSAGGATNRPLDNEQAVEALFTERGYAPIAPETLAYEDQIRLFAGAERIAGAAGAAFALLPFTAPGTHVVQLGHRMGWYYPWHAYASNFTALRHFAYHEHPARIAMQQGPGWTDVESWSIDVPRLARVLDGLAARWG